MKFNNFNRFAEFIARLNCIFLSLYPIAVALKRAHTARDTQRALNYAAFPRHQLLANTKPIWNPAFGAWKTLLLRAVNRASKRQPNTQKRFPIDPKKASWLRWMIASRGNNDAKFLGPTHSALLVLQSTQTNYEQAAASGEQLGIKR